MTLAKIVPWQELLSRPARDTSDQYGPNSRAVASAIVALSNIPWFERVGEPWLEDATAPLTDVTIVSSWADALSIFGDFPKYNINGVLQTAHEACSRVVDRDPAREAWWQKARMDVRDYVSLVVPDHLDQEHQDLMFEHTYEYVSMLLVEIIAAPEAECAYFREQLAWYYAGHFPCGWDGGWPEGRMRMY